MQIYAESICTSKLQRPVLQALPCFLNKAAEGLAGTYEACKTITGGTQHYCLWLNISLQMAANTRHSLQKLMASSNAH
jgi:hypothetical protein